MSNQCKLRQHILNAKQITLMNTGKCYLHSKVTKRKKNIYDDSWLLIKTGQFIKKSSINIMENRQ